MNSTKTTQKPIALTNKTLYSIYSSSFFSDEIVSVLKEISKLENLSGVFYLQTENEKTKALFESYKNNLFSHFFNWDELIKQCTNSENKAPFYLELEKIKAHLYLFPIESDSKIYQAFGYISTEKIPTSDDFLMLQAMCCLRIENQVKNREIKQLKTRLKEVQELAQIGYWEYKPETNCFIDQGAIPSIFGEDLSQSIFTFEQLSELLHPENRSFVVEHLSEALKSNADFDLESKLLLPNGVEKYVHIIRKNKFNDKGRLEESFGLVQDVTYKKLLEISEHKYRILIESADDRIVLFDENNHLIYANSAFYTKVGYSKKEFEGLRPRKLYSPNYFRECRTLKEVLKHEPSYAFEYQILHKEGHWLDMYAKCVRLNDENNQFKGYLAITRDISFQKSTQKDLMHAKRKAEESDYLKSAFLANMSHEIRTPINAIIGFSNLLIEKKSDSDKYEKFAKIIRSSSKQLLSIINDIIDISKLESGQLEIHHSKFDLNYFFDEIQLIHQNAIKTSGKKLRLSIVKSKNRPIIHTDYNRLCQICNNLLNNAIKFSEKGTIELGYKENKEKYVFWVKDEGIGIEGFMHQKIFHPFVQESIEVSGKYGGNGLGLAICQNLVEKLGGEIWLESVKNVGSTFYFYIPKQTSYE